MRLKNSSRPDLKHRGHPEESRKSLTEFKQRTDGMYGGEGTSQNGLPILELSVNFVYGEFYDMMASCAVTAISKRFRYGNNP